MTDADLLSVLMSLAQSVQEAVVELTELNENVFHLRRIDAKLAELSEAISGLTSVVENK